VAQDSTTKLQMSTKRNKQAENTEGCTIRARVKRSLKIRVANYRQRPDVQRSEGFVVRQAVEEYLNSHESQPGKV